MQLLAVLLANHLEPCNDNDDNDDYLTDANDDDRTCRLHVVNPDDATAGRVPMSGVVDGPPAQVVSLLVSQVVPAQDREIIVEENNVNYKSANLYPSSRTP